MVDTEVSGGRGKLAVLADGTEEDDNDATLSPTKVSLFCCCQNFGTIIRTSS